MNSTQRQFRLDVARCSDLCILGRATLTMVSSSTSMSCAVAMTSRARPSLRPVAGGAAAWGAVCVASWGDMALSLSPFRAP